VNHLAIGAIRTQAGRPEGLGVARFVRLEGRPAVADVAITVLDHVQRKGLGRLLLTRLMAAARERGIQRFESDVLATNAAMRRLVRSLVPGTIERADGRTVRMEMPLPRWSVESTRSMSPSPGASSSTR